MKLLVATAVALLVLNEPGVQGQTFRSSTEGILVDVAVTRGNRAVEGLRAEDFELTDNGVRQTILDVTQDAWPIDLTLVVDLSGGAFLQSTVVAGANRLIREGLRPGDRVRVVTFARGAREHAALSSPEAIAPLTMSRGIHDAFTASSQSALFDAIALATVTAPAPGRRQVAIVFSADRDSSSLLDDRTAIDVARRSGQTVFVVQARLNFTPTGPLPEGATPRPSQRLPYPVSSRFYRDLAEATGGTVQVVEPVKVHRNPSGGSRVSATFGKDLLSEAFVQVLDRFRSSYVLRYTPQGVPPADWHEISVKVARPGRYDVRAKRGYAGR